MIKIQKPTEKFLINAKMNLKILILKIMENLFYFGGFKFTYSYYLYLYKS